MGLLPKDRIRSTTVITLGALKGGMEMRLLLAMHVMVTGTPLHFLRKSWAWDKI